MGIIELTFESRSATFRVDNSNANLGKIGCNTRVREFLSAHRKHFGKDDAGYWLEPGRIGKFKLNAQSKGFDVVTVGR